MPAKLVALVAYNVTQLVGLCVLPFVLIVNLATAKNLSKSLKKAANIVACRGL